MGKIGLAAACLVLGSCAAERHGEPFVPEVVDPARSVVYVYRPPGMGARAVGVVINQEFAGSLMPGEYLCREVPAAETLVRVEGESSSARPVALRPGDAAYMEVRVAPLGPARPTLELVESETARRALSRATRAGR